MSTGKKRLLILFVLVSAALTLMSYQHNKKAFSFLDIISYPYYAISEFRSNIDTRINRIRHTFHENDRLRKEVNQLLVEKQLYREVMLENERLKALLSLKEREPRYEVAARIIGRGPDKLLNIAVLDRGGKAE